MFSVIGSLRISRLNKTWENRPNIYVSVFAFISLTTFIIRLVSDFIWGSYVSVAIQLALIIVTLGIYWLNEAGRHRAAKVTLIVFLNVIIFGYCNVAPKDLGIYFYFAPVIGATSLIFAEQEKRIRNWFFVAPIVLIFTLISTDFQVFGSININEGIDDTTSNAVNLLISHLILVFVLITMGRLNYELDRNRIATASELQTKSTNMEKINQELLHFSYRTSHDLKAPLTSVLGLINIARYEVTDKNALLFFSKIEERVRKLMAFIRDILQLSRNAQTDLQADEIKIGHIISEVIENNKEAYNAEEIEFLTEVQVVGKIVSDRLRIEIILNNLISNAIKYQKVGTHRKQIKVVARHERDHLFLNVADNGIGIDDASKTKVFEMFYRGHENSDGSGLGLYIVSDVVTKMKGTISFDSRENIGTSVDISLPLRRG